MRVHGMSGGSGRRRERRFGGSSSLFRPTTGTPTGCELLVACDDAALIHGVKVEPMLKLEFELFSSQSNPRRIHAHLRVIANQGFLQAYSPDPPRPPNSTSQSLAHPTSFFARALTKSPRTPRCHPRRATRVPATFPAMDGRRVPAGSSRLLDRDAHNFRPGVAVEFAQARCSRCFCRRATRTL